MEILFRERKTIKKRVQNLKKDGFYSPYQKKTQTFMLYLIMCVIDEFLKIESIVES